MAKVLIVDDEKNILELVSFLLETDGHSVDTAADGRECLDKVKGTKPDLIVLDVMMPVMDGYTVCTKLAQEDESRGIPVVILTARGQMKDMFTLNSNVVSCIEKPFDPNELRDQVNRALTAHPN